MRFLFTSAAILCEVVLPIEAPVAALPCDSCLAGAGPAERVAGKASNNTGGVTVTCCRWREKCGAHS